MIFFLFIKTILLELSKRLQYANALKLALLKRLIDFNLTRVNLTRRSESTVVFLGIYNACYSIYDLYMSANCRILVLDKEKCVVEKSASRVQYNIIILRLTLDRGLLPSIC